MKQLLILLISLLSFTLSAQENATFVPNIRSLRVMLNGEWDTPPVMIMGRNDFVEISFDDLTHEYKRYSYTIQHCNADWQPSDLLESDYLDGFNNVVLDDYEQSMNTKMEYNRYSFTLPNDDINLLVSGNYRVQLFEDDRNEPVAQCCFSIMEPHVTIASEISGNTDIDTYKSHQQISFNINHTNYTIRNPHQELMVSVYQNRRIDNAVHGVKPTFIQQNQLRYTHNRSLIFNAGNEFRRFEILDEYIPTMHVERMDYHEPYYHATLFTDEKRINYIFDKDQDGRYYVRNNKDIDNETESDYFYTHFRLAMPQVPGGDIYICGDLTNNRFVDYNRMTYNPIEHTYEATLLLKQGSYNYQYLFVPNGKTRGYTVTAEGNFHQTENEYQIYVYHRPFGERYDKLIGFTTIKNQIPEL